MGIFTELVRENLQTITGKTYVPSSAEADRDQRMVSQDSALTALTAITLRDSTNTVRQQARSRTLG
jgi:hypothetical protein